MRVTAWMCDRCGRMHPGESKPLDWVEVSTSIVGQRDSKEDGLFCSDKCAGLWFRNRREEVMEEEDHDDLFHETHEKFKDYKCPQCDWTPGMRKTGGRSKPLTNPEQSLKMHISRTHGKLQGNPNMKVVS